MASLLNRTCLTLLLATSACGSLLALDANKWSRVLNDSDNIYNVTITDLNSIGSLHIRPKGDPSDGVEMGKGVLKGKGMMASAALEAHKEYEFYFETNLMTQNAMKFKLQNTTKATDYTEFRFSNIGSATVGSETIELNAPSLGETHMLVDPSGYRNSKGGTLITIK